jgi:hypothetical protein
MPFNVITLNSTLVAGLFGTLFNLLTKRLRGRRPKRMALAKKNKKCKKITQQN